MPRPLQAAVFSAVSFSLGAAFRWRSHGSRRAELIWIIAVSSLVFLALLGAVAARAGGASILRGSVRVLFWGAIAMAATALVGRLVRHDALGRLSDGEHLRRSSRRSPSSKAQARQSAGHHYDRFAGFDDACSISMRSPIFSISSVESESHPSGRALSRFRSLHPARLCSDPRDRKAARPRSARVG